MKRAHADNLDGAAALGELNRRDEPSTATNHEAGVGALQASVSMPYGPRAAGGTAGTGRRTSGNFGKAEC
ncbi:hypothetical protein E4U38_006933 [Claviceps purpurea]|nr:hypothetical protein E4U38_006933 [Claviceps purpurea]